MGVPLDQPILLTMNYRLEGLTSLSPRGDHHYPWLEGIAIMKHRSQGHFQKFTKEASGTQASDTFTSLSNHSFYLDSSALEYLTVMDLQLPDIPLGWNGFPLMGVDLFRLYSPLPYHHQHVENYPRTKWKELSLSDEYR